MPLNNYGVLKGRPIEVRLGTGQNAHYQVRLVDDTRDYRIAINVMSSMSPSEVEYVVIEELRHPVTRKVAEFPLGFTELANNPISGALDYIRGNLFDRALMRPLPFNVPGHDNDLNEKINRVMQRALGDEQALIYAFGERWGPEPGSKDKYFGFLPGNGIHDIHMNQGNLGRFVESDGVWQDGGLFVHFPKQNEWVGIFLKFQSQAWHTNDQTGNRVVGTTRGYMDNVETGVDAALPVAMPSRIELPDRDEPQGLVRIIAALVNSTASPEKESVTLLNTAAHEVALDGWAIVDTSKVRVPLSGTLAAGATKVVQIVRPASLSNQGGVITLLEENGLKVDGVAYTREQVRHPGWTIVF